MFLGDGEARRLTRAGIELGISEAAVSQRIKSLEGYLATKLYESRGGHVRLTTAGERTMDKAIAIFRDLEDFERDIASGDEDSRIALCTHDSVLRYLLPPAVAEFASKHPLARLRPLARPVARSIELVRTNEADIGIIPEQAVPAELSFEPIVTCPAFLILPTGFAACMYSAMLLTSSGPRARDDRAPSRRAGGCDRTAPASIDAIESA